MSDINWSQKRKVYRNTETGEFYVRVEGGYMLDTDYMEGGRVELRVEPLEEVGTFTNAQISNFEYSN